MSAHRNSRSTHFTQEWEYTPTRDDNKIGPLTDFDSYWFSLALNFEEYTSTHSTQAIKKSSRKNRIISLILSIFYANYFKYMEKWEYSPTRDDNKIGPLTDFDSYWFSLALNFDECTSRVYEWEYTPTRDDNKIGPLTDFDSYWFSLALNFEEYTSTHSTQAIKKSSRKNRIISLILSIFYANYFKYMEKWEYSPTRDDNKIGPLTDFDSYWFSLALNFDECTSSTWKSGNTLPPVTTTKSDL
ncbi:LOW QUALITY PROTEIN: hypothetical protein V1477_007936 [Vespula maculifrons]|uniref:Uncharacterized protein n=1 Tax=Vespula maculifrons TaxID=7453 RepID=A0ABD2CG85_VESMC